MSAGVGSATWLRLAATSAVLGIHLASAPAATATTAPIPAILKNCRREAPLAAALPARPIGWAAPVVPALGLSVVDCTLRQGVRDRRPCGGVRSWPSAAGTTWSRKTVTRNQIPAAPPSRIGMTSTMVAPVRLKTAPAVIRISAAVIPTAIRGLHPPDDPDDDARPGTA